MCRVPPSVSLGWTGTYIPWTIWNVQSKIDVLITILAKEWRVCASLKGWCPGFQSVHCIWGENRVLCGNIIRYISNTLSRFSWLRQENRTTPWHKPLEESPRGLGEAGQGWSLLGCSESHCWPSPWVSTWRWLPALRGESLALWGKEEEDDLGRQSSPAMPAPQLSHSPGQTGRKMLSSLTPRGGTFPGASRRPCTLLCLMPITKGKTYHATQ